MPCVVVVGAQLWRCCSVPYYVLSMALIGSAADAWLR